MNFSRFFVFFFTHVSSVLFSSLFVFVHDVSLSPHFSFPFMFDLLFSWLPVFFEHNFHLPLYHNVFNLSLFECMRYLCMSFCSWICSPAVSFSLFVFLVSNTCVSLFLLSSLSITSRKDKYMELLQSKKKNLFVYLPFWCAFFHIYLSLLFLFFRIFFRFILMCFLTFFF